MSRRSDFVAFCSLLTANLFVVLYRQDWVGEWSWTVDTSVGSVILSAPVLAVVGGLHGLALKRALAVLAPQSRRLSMAVRAIVRVWAVGVRALVVSTIVALAMTALATNGGPVAPWAWVLGPAVLLVAAALGVLVGHAAGRWVVVALLGPAFFVAGGLLPGWAGAWLRQGGTTGSLAGLAFDPGQVTAVATGAVGVAVCAAVVVAKPGTTSRAVAVLGAVLVVGSLVVSFRNGGETLVPGHETASACSEVAPVTVCVAPSNVVLLSRLAASASTGARALEAAGARVPARFDAQVPYADPIPADRGVLPDLRTQDPVRLVLTPAPCSGWFDPSSPPPPQAFEAQQLIADVLATSAGSTPAAGPFEQWLVATPVVVQRAWLVETYAALTDCRLDEIVLPAP